MSTRVMSSENLTTAAGAGAGAGVGGAGWCWELVADAALVAAMAERVAWFLSCCSQNLAMPSFKAITETKDGRSPPVHGDKRFEARCGRRQRVLRRRRRQHGVLPATHHRTTSRRSSHGAPPNGASDCRCRLLSPLLSSVHLQPAASAGDLLSLHSSTVLLQALLRLRPPCGDLLSPLLSSVLSLRPLFV
ncbi:hypothetical protein ZWY2020_031523 [Hordeum vulgare]|nr:hypothetical protein ZWY2020_031523 [Hordeum vulgare]